MESEKKEITAKKPKLKSKAFDVFKESFDQESEADEKIVKALEFMKAALANTEKGAFKDFWDAKKLVGPLFKEKINPIKRNHLWNQYIELADEARQIKEIKDEQAAFSIQQVELAIEALENDLNHYDRLIGEMKPLNFPKGLKKLSVDKENYHSIQKELDLLKAFISRLNGLRKEILSIDMRISHKNKILKRLSKLGDAVFPKRKERIKQINQAFAQDIDAFVNNRFPKGEEKLGAPYYTIRDEIKIFQGFAKMLTLNTQTFTKTRNILGECWDKIKEKEKERRLEMGERFEEQKKNFDQLVPKVEAFEAFCMKEENQERDKILEESNALQNEMKEISLSRDHVKILKDRIQKVRTEGLDKVEEKIEKKKDAIRKEIEDFKGKLDVLIKSEESESLEDLEAGEQKLRQMCDRFNLSGTETLIFERKFFDLRSSILNKKETVLSVDKLEDLYEERLVHIEAIKKQVEASRKEMNRSNLDFEKAMTYRELYDSAKILLDVEVEALENLEEKLV